MARVGWWVGVIVGGLGASWGAGCVADEERLDQADTETQGLDLADTASSPDGDSGLAITTFQVDLASITRGDGAGGPIEGQATLSWATRGAARIELRANGVPIALEGCAAGGACAEAGSLAVRPTETTTFALRALPEGGCEEGCPEAEVTVEVRAPARVRLSETQVVAQAGATVEIGYEVEGATDFAVGVLRDEAFAACAIGEDAAEAPCVRIGEASGAARFEALERTMTLAVTATNGAADGLGDVRLGDALAQIQVPVVVSELTATPAKVLPGGRVVLAWAVSGAQSVSVTADSEEVVGLSTCVGLGEDGRGFCTVDLDPDAALGEVHFELVAEQDTGVAGQARAQVEVIGGPTLDEVAVAPLVVVPGQDLTVRWAAYGADAVVVRGAGLEGLEGCGQIGDDGRGSCVVRAGSGLGARTVEVEASNRAIGPADVEVVALEVVAPPRVTAFEVDDATVEAGARVTLSWQTADALAVVLMDGSGGLAPSELEACALSGPSGSCEIGVPAGLEPGLLELGLTAVGATGARSEVEVLGLEIGERPTPTLSASPEVLPQGGGAVSLRWEAPGATRVVVIDDGEPADLVVDTSAATMCNGSPCEPEGDAVALQVGRATAWTLTAENDFGEARVEARVTLAGAPVVERLTLGGVDARAGRVVVDAASEELAWEVSALGAADAVSVQTAPSPGPQLGCGGVTAWATVAGFPKVGAATGAASLGGFEGAARCVRFVAEDRDATPVQRVSVVVAVVRAPEIGAFAAEDATVQRGDVVRLSWATQRAYGVALEVAPVGAVTSQQLAGCTAPSGGCEVVIQAGTPLGDVRFTLVARGEAGAGEDRAEVGVTVGVGAKVGAFAASPTSMSAAGPVTLSWRTSDATTVTLAQGATTLLTATDRPTMDAGEREVQVAVTTTWVLTAKNEYGVASSQVTTFVGPSIDLLTANGGNALDGDELVVTGPVTIGWATTSADGAHRLAVADVPANGDCNAAGVAYTTVYVEEEPTASASHALGVVTKNRCVRLTVTNAQQPPQSGVATFLLRERPEIASLTTSPGTLPTSGGTVIVALGLRGVSGLTVTAQYRAADGEVLGTRTVCDERGLNGGSLTGGAGLDEVQCAHQLVPCNLLCLNNGVPSRTTTVRYFVATRDEEGETAGRDSADGEDVRLQ